MTPNEAPDQQLSAALDALAQAVKDALAFVRAMPPDQAAFTAATELADTLREAAEVGAGLRSETVRRIRDVEQLSLAALAERIGVSKARAGQLAGSTKNAKEKT